MSIFGLGALATSAHGVLVAGAIGALIGAASIGTGAWYVTKAVYQDKLDNKIIEDQKAQIAAVNLARSVQSNQDNINRAADIDQARQQGILEGRENAATRYITQHVPTSVACVPFGVVRVINFAALGTDPTSIAPGESDEACAPVSWRSFADDLTDDYITGNKNIIQLDGLTADVRKLNAAVNGAIDEAKPKPNWFDRNILGQSADTASTTAPTGAP